MGQSATLTASPPTQRWWGCQNHLKSSEKLKLVASGRKKKMSVLSSNFHPTSTRHQAAYWLNNFFPCSWLVFPFYLQYPKVEAAPSLSQTTGEPSAQNPLKIYTYYTLIKSAFKQTQGWASEKVLWVS